MRPVPVSQTRNLFKVQAGDEKFVDENMYEFICSTCLFSIYSDTLIRYMQSKQAKTLMFLKTKYMICLCVKIIVY